MSGWAVRIRFQLLGLVFLVVVALFLSVCVAVYDKAFSDEVPVRLETDHVGNQLHVGSDVKIRGVIVGEVRQVHGYGNRAVLDLAMDPRTLGQIPANVSARLLPKTLFGERYVALRPPPRKSGAHLAAGDVIPEDRSSSAIEIDKVLADLMPTLRALQPEKVSATLGAISQALDGRGKQAGDTVRNLNQYLQQINPSLPQVNEDIQQLTAVADGYNHAAPELLHALSNLTTTTRTVVDEKDELAQLSGQLTTTAVDARAFLEVNRDNLIRLTGTARPTLEVLAKYAPEYPCVFTQMANQIEKGDRSFGKGKQHTNMGRLTMEFSPSRGKYEPGKDVPRYEDARGPRCYQAATPDNPFPQYPPDGPVQDGSTHPPPPVSDAGKSWPYSTGANFPLPGGLSTQASTAPATTGPASSRGGPEVPLLANSPQEQRLISALLAPQLGEQPSAVPNWGSLLVGPVLRGQEVALR
jgi:virulence factor Mce-like protein